MRWCILPAHTHLQIRLDLHESNEKNPRIRARERARDRGKIGILAKEQVQCNNSDRNQRKQDTPPPHKTTYPASRRGVASQRHTS